MEGSNPNNLAMYWAIIIIAALGAGAGFKYWVVPWLNLWIHNSVAKWWINVVAPIAIVLGILMWGAFWTGSFGYMYHEIKVRLPRLEFFRDIGDAADRTKGLWEKKTNVDVATPEVPQGTPAPGTGYSYGTPCYSVWCTGDHCPDGCGAPGAPGWVCHDGIWTDQGHQSWKHAPPCPGK